MRTLGAWSPPPLRPPCTQQKCTEHLLHSFLLQFVSRDTEQNLPLSFLHRPHQQEQLCSRGTSAPEGSTALDDRPHTPQCL